jgi:CRP/FNR family transcriptional regulator, cyclic AMP receptor protein
MNLTSASGAGAARRDTQLSPELFDLLFAGCTPEHYRAGHYLFMQEDMGERVYGVISGTIEIAIFSLGGRKLVANLETPKSMVGEIAALDGGPRTATATCLTECELVSMSRNRLLERIREEPALAVGLIELLCARLRWVSGELGDQALLKIETRLAKRLVFLSGLIGNETGWIEISQSELAEFLGATRESVNKALTDWRRDGVISIRRGGLRIESMRRLRDIAAAEDD